jgi:hypothetical protein
VKISPVWRKPHRRHYFSPRTKSCWLDRENYLLRASLTRKNRKIKKSWFTVSLSPEYGNYVFQLTLYERAYRVTDYFSDDPIFAFFVSIFESQTIQFA